MRAMRIRWSLVAMALVAGSCSDRVDPVAPLGQRRSGVGGGPAVLAGGPASLLKDVNTFGSMNGDSSPSGFVALAGNTVLFVASTSDTGTELWSTDGTEPGTVLVKDINVGASSSAPLQLTRVGATVYFVAFEPSSGWELWKTDGTDAGTALVKDIMPGTMGSDPGSLTEVNGTLYFTAGDPVTGRELWKTDGTEAGTVVVKDIAPGAASSDPDGDSTAFVIQVCRL